jgi:hypothetical protein|tara:strand:+ start:844 stop:1005 length:162 start_codon:yes stop_codon:yes gene_type:complete
MKSIGLGDSLEKITKTTGIKTLTEIAANAMGIKDCGCNKRKNWLNNQFPYKYK